MPRRNFSEMTSELNRCLIGACDVQLRGEINWQRFWSLRFGDRLILIKNESLEVCELRIV